MRKLIALVEQRDKFLGDRGRLVNRLGHALKQYYPQVLEWFNEHHTVVFCDFLSRWPTLTQVKRARKANLERFFKSHHVHSVQLIEKRITAIKAAMPLTADPAVIEPHRLQVEILIEQLRITIKALKRFDDEIAATAHSCLITICCSARYPVLRRSWHRDCWPRSVKTGNAIRTPMPCRCTQGSRR